MKSGWRYTQTTASHTTKGNPMKCRVLILIEGSGASGPLYIQAAQHLGLHQLRCRLIQISTTTLRRKGLSLSVLIPTI